MAKCEIAHDEQFLLWPQCFQLYLTVNKAIFYGDFSGFYHYVLKSSAADLLYMGKDANDALLDIRND